MLGGAQVQCCVYYGCGEGDVKGVKVPAREPLQLTSGIRMRVCRRLARRGHGGAVSERRFSQRPYRDWATHQAMHASETCRPFFFLPRLCVCLPSPGRRIAVCVHFSLSPALSLHPSSHAPRSFAVRSGVFAAMAPRQKTTIGFQQFKGQGASFYLRQFSGCAVVVAGIACLFMPHVGEADAPVAGLVHKNYFPFIALFLVCVGTYLHETRPFRVRSACDA